MKTLFLILLLGLIMIGCSSTQWERATRGGILNPIPYARMKYPECNQETTAGDWYNCINRIVEKEGRVR